MRRKVDFIKWKSNNKELKKFKALYGIFTYSGFITQVILLDHGEPIGVLLQKPERISVYNNNICGTFILNEHELKKGKPGVNSPRAYYIVAVYYKYIKAFICELKDSREINYVIKNNYIKYLELQDRKKVQDLLTKNNISLVGAA